jgi:hypothetical protein
MRRRDQPVNKCHCHFLFFLSIRRLAPNVKHRSNRILDFDIVSFMVMAYHFLQAKAQNA